MNGKEFRLRRFLSRSEKIVVAAFDHGAFLGPLPGLVNPREVSAGLQHADGVLMAPGMIHLVNDLFVGKRAPALLTRLAWSSNYCFHLDYHEGYHRDMLSVGQAAALGADLVVCSLAIETGSERVDAENAGAFSRHAQQAMELGVPLVGEFFPPLLKGMSADDLQRQTKITCRVMAELGADIIKTVYTGQRFAEIVESTPVPLLVLGAEKTPTEEQALKLALDAVNSGAAGIVFGRNIVQSACPAGFIEAVREVMSGHVEIGEALAKHNLKRVAHAHC